MHLNKRSVQYGATGRTPLRKALVMTCLTGNFAMGLPEHNGGIPGVDSAVRVSDQEALEMAHHLLRHEGVFLGSSAAVNCVAAVKVARTLPPKSNVVTILCVTWQRTFFFGVSKFPSNSFSCLFEFVPCQRPLKTIEHPPLEHFNFYFFLGRFPTYSFER